MNVYDSDFAWPTGTKIERLRIIQVLPKSTPPPNEPRDRRGPADERPGRAGNRAGRVRRQRLFRGAGRQARFIFQALDERRLGGAVDAIGHVRASGRAAAVPGLPRAEAPPPPTPAVALPLAIAPEPSRSSPTSTARIRSATPRLVQPVLDRHCVECHGRKTPSRWGTSRAERLRVSYNNLAGKYGFYFDVTNGSINGGVHGGSRTEPGRFGARAAPLLTYLSADHYGVTLSPQERGTVTLWLDCNSEFLGAYEEAAAQVRGEAVQPSLE